MTRETCMVKARGLKIHTNVYNFVTAPPQNHINSLKFYLKGTNSKITVFAHF